jgi:hypothetical protein
LALGGRTIAEWQEVMSSEEFVDWQLYYETNPFGPKRGDMQAAIVASTIANVNAPKGKKYAVKDFLLEFKPPRDRDAMTNDDIRSFFQRLSRT